MGTSEANERASIYGQDTGSGEEDWSVVWSSVESLGMKSVEPIRDSRISRLPRFGTGHRGAGFGTTRSRKAATSDICTEYWYTGRGLERLAVMHAVRVHSLPMSGGHQQVKKVKCARAVIGFQRIDGSGPSGPQGMRQYPRASTEERVNKRAAQCRKPSLTPRPQGPGIVRRRRRSTRADSGPAA